MTPTSISRFLRLSALALAVGGCGAALHAQTTDPDTAVVASAVVAQDRLVSTYSSLIGSEADTRAVVSALSTGGTLTLGTGTPDAVSFASPTKPMGLGEVNIALGLAQDALAQQGITSPTPAQLQAALVGGMVTTSTGEVSLAGVLQQRATGLGWGQIAQSYGFKLGEVVSARHREQAQAKAAAGRSKGQSTAAQSRGSSGKAGSAGGNAGGQGGGQGSGQGRGK